MRMDKLGPVALEHHADILYSRISRYNDLLLRRANTLNPGTQALCCCMLAGGTPRKRVSLEDSHRDRSGGVLSLEDSYYQPPRKRLSLEDSHQDPSGSFLSLEDSHYQPPGKRLSLKDSHQDRSGSFLSLEDSYYQILWDHSGATPCLFPTLLPPWHFQ